MTFVVDLKVALIKLELVNWHLDEIRESLQLQTQLIYLLEQYLVCLGKTF